MKEYLCRTCNDKKPINEMVKKTDSKNGIENRCKECKQEYQLRYYENNKENVNKTKKKWLENNKEKIRAYQKEYQKAYKAKNKKVTITEQKIKAFDLNPNQTVKQFIIENNKTASDFADEYSINPNTLKGYIYKNYKIKYMKNKNIKIYDTRNQITRYYHCDNEINYIVMPYMMPANNTIHEWLHDR